MTDPQDSRNGNKNASDAPSPDEDFERRSSAGWRSLWLGFFMGLATAAAAILSQSREPWIETATSVTGAGLKPNELETSPTLRAPASGSTRESGGP